MQRFLKTPVIIILVVVLAGVAGAWWWHTRNHSSMSFRTAMVKRGDVTATISASGTIEPEEVVDIGAQVAGLIKSFGTDINGKTIDYGSVIEEGAVLAKIDESVYTAELSVGKAGELSATANLEQMNAKLDQSKAEWKRVQELFNSKLVSQVDYDSAKANFEIATANVSVANSQIALAHAALEKAQRNLDFCIIKSPVNGVIIEMIALVGTSGSGKSTLMNIVGCLDRPTSGKYWLDGQDISSITAEQRATVRNLKIGFVFQNFNLLPRTTALQNVLMPLNYTAAHLTDKECRERGEAALRLVGLGDRMDHEPSQLSGGQQQRVAIARALINRPPVLFADEPTGNLDSRTTEDVLKMFQKLNEEEGLTIIIVTHDENVARHTKRVIRM